MPKLLKYYMKGGGGRSLGTPKSDYLICARPLSVIGLRHPECHIYGKGWQKRLFRKPSPKAMEWHIFVRKAPLTMFRFQIITYHCYHLQHYLLSAIYYLLGLLLLILVSMVGVSLHRLSGADVPACPPPWWQEPPEPSTSPSPHLPLVVRTTDQSCRSDDHNPQKEAPRPGGQSGKRKTRTFWYHGNLYL